MPPAKLARPALPAFHLTRPAVERRLDDAFARRLTTVVAGAGFGKSTTLAAWTAELASAWYTIDRTDRSLSGLAAGLAAALGVGDVAALTEQSGSDEHSRTGPLASLLCELLEQRLESDFFIVLDDLHELPRRSSSARLIEALCRQAPPLLHLMLCSRAEPPFPVERLRGRGEVLTLGAAELAFSEEEVAQLLARELGSGELAPRVHELSAGWPAAVRLAIEALREAPDREQALTSLPRPGGSLFEYLAGEAFSREPRGVRRLLRNVAPLERFSVGLCEELGVERAEEMLLALERRGLFVQRQGGEAEWFTLHALVRDFALARWPLREGERHELSARAARWLERNGLIDDALHAATAGSDAAEVARLLADHGAELVAHGSADDVLAAAAVIPVGRDAQVEQVIGEAHMLKGDWEDALGCYRRAAGEADELPAALAWCMGRIHWDRGEFDDALAAFSRGRLDGSDPGAEAFLLAWTCSVHWNRADIDAARDGADAALVQARESGDDRALAAAHYALALVALGRDDEAAERDARRGLDLAERAGDVLQTIRLRLLLGGVLPPAPASREIEPAVRLAELAGADLYLAAALNSRGNQRQQLGQLDAAVADHERTRAIWARHGSTRVGWALMNLGSVYRERGDLALARAALEEAVEIVDRAPEGQGLMGANAELARVLVADDPERAIAHVDRAVEAGRSLAYGISEPLLAKGWVSLAIGDRETAAGVGAEAVDLAPRDQPSFAAALEVQALSSLDGSRTRSLLEQALAVWRALGNPLGCARAEYALARLAVPPDALAARRAKRRLRELGVRESAAGAAGLLMALGPERPPPLAIQALGGFRVVRDGVPVPASEWQSRKARAVLKLLVARRGRLVTREQLVDALWSGDDPEKTANRLSVALSTVRSVLDPEHRHPSDHYVRSSEDTVALELDRVVLDAEGFAAEAEAGLAALREGRTEEALELLEAAEASYAGDFLEEDLYEDWAAPPREELRATYIAVVRALAAESADEKTAARYYLRLLERDPHDEDAHLGLVSAHTEGRAHGEARRAYRAYVARMEEIGVEPAPFPSAA